MSEPTLLQIVPSLSGGGLARAALDAAQAVVAAGGSAIVASPGGGMVPDLLRLRASHIEVPPFDHPVRTRFTLPGRLAAALRQYDVSLIQARSPATALVARQLAQRLGVKWIATLYRPFSTRGLVDRLIERRQVYADAVIAVSDHIARDASKNFPELGDRLHTIAPGINLDRFDPAIVRADRVIRLAGELRVPDGSHLVLCPGRFVDDGGQKVLIEAMKRLGRSDVFCLLLGSTGVSTPFERECEEAIERADLLGRVQIGPYVEDMPAAYMLADVVVSTGGALQGFSRALVEAQAMGRPVAAVDGGGAAEAMRAGVTGWLAPTGDSDAQADALAEALSQALSLDVERRAELARAAQHHVRERFALTNSSQQLLRLYRQLSK